MPEIISKTAWKASTSPSVPGFLSPRCLLSLSDSVPRAALGRGRFLVAPLSGAAAHRGRRVDRSWETQTVVVLWEEPPAPPARGGSVGAAGTPRDRRDRPAGPELCPAEPRAIESETFQGAKMRLKSSGGTLATPPLQNTSPNFSS